MSITMKGISQIMASVVVVALFVSSNGCMTMATADHAKAKTHEDDKGNVVVDKKSQPAYYALMPLTVPADIVTLPFQAVYLYIVLGRD
jgi:uncharacterized protein YceK